jgi:uncharacterized protein (DUF1684 family)
MTTDAAPTTFVDDWRAWHAAHEAARASEHGFLAVTSIRWLGEEPERFPDAPGAWHTGPDGVVVELDDGESLVVEGRTVTGRHSFGVLVERGGTTAAFGDAVVEVARRGGADILRPRHPDSPRLAGYTGTPTYDPDPRWALAARFRAYEVPVPTAVGSVVEGLEHVYEAVGELALEVDGRPLRLVAFPGAADGSLLVLFRDLTSGVTTHPAVRSVSVPAPDAADATIVDLNRAVNLPCAYTPYATCPLPPEDNHLPVAVEAGERLPA